MSLTSKRKSSISPIGVLVVPSAIIMRALAAQLTQQLNWSMNCLVMILLVNLLSKISLMKCPSTLASVYIMVIDLVFNMAPLNNGTGVVSLSSKGNMTIKVLSSVLVTGEILLGFLMLFELDLIAVFELQVSDKLFVAVVIDILLVAVVNKLKFDIQVVNILAVVSLTDNQSSNVLVYHSSGKHMSPTAIVDWSRMTNMTNSGNDLRFFDYCIIVEMHSTDALKDATVQSMDKLV
ncbi:hypothetical protein G9A89_011452 [Geosiphon pyriformis]|nr:hypothetical protein G9A89_011452 [Geosiphon pyriformis]